MRSVPRLVFLLIFFFSGCGDDDSGQTTGPTAPPPSAAPSGTWVRLANFSSDLDGAEVRLDGGSFLERIGYPRVTRYRRVEPGTHVVRFIPGGKAEIDPRTVQLDLRFDVITGDAVTIVAAGLVDTRTLAVADFRDEIGSTGGDIRVRLVNTMSDFPATLGLWLNSETPLVRNVAFLEDRGYRSASPGNHPLEVRRTGTGGALLPVTPFALAGNATYTMFAFGTLRKGDLDQMLVLDASQGSPALKR